MNAQRPRVLIIQTARIGDLLCTTPMIREIKRAIPGAFVAVVTGATTSDVLKGNPHIDQTIPLPGIGLTIRPMMSLILVKILKRSFDYCFIANDEQEWILLSVLAGIPVRVGFDLPVKHFLFRCFSWSLTERVAVGLNDNMSMARLKLLRILGIESRDPSPNVFYDENDRRVVDDALRNEGIKPDDLVVAITPFTSRAVRDWYADRWEEVARRLIAQYGAAVILIGSTQNYESLELLRKRIGSRSHNIAAKTSVNQLAYLFTKVTVHLSTDTGPVFIAASVGTPGVIVAGPHPFENLSHLPKTVVLSKDIPCYPCSFPLRTIDRCTTSLEEFACKKRTTVDEVMTAAQALLRGDPGFSTKEGD